MLTKPDKLELYRTYDFDILVINIVTIVLSNIFTFLLPTADFKTFLL